jgi:hypothetical protein
MESYLLAADEKGGGGKFKTERLVDQTLASEKAKRGITFG